MLQNFRFKTIGNETDLNNLIINSNITEPSFISSNRKELKEWEKALYTKDRSDPPLGT